MRKLILIWPLAVVLVLLIATAGCCGSRGCGPVCCMPPSYYAPPCAVPACPQRRFNEPQWQYLDKEGSPRLMGDAALRDHLGLTTPAQPVASP